MGLKILGKEFAIKTLITVGMQSMFLVVVPIPAVPLIEDYLTACIIGGIIAGTGTGLVLRGRSSGGGQDIIGLCCSKKYPNISVSKINILMNIFVYAICLFLFNIEIVIYSLIYTTVLAMAIDKYISNIMHQHVMLQEDGLISRAVCELEQTKGVCSWRQEAPT